jgi:hypothetical protein
MEHVVRLTSFGGYVARIIAILQFIKPRTIFFGAKSTHSSDRNWRVRAYRDNSIPWAAGAAIF